MYYYKQKQKQRTDITHDVKLTDQLLFKNMFLDENYYIGEMWLTHGTKHHRAISSLVWNTPVDYFSVEYNFDAKGFHGYRLDPMF